MISYTKNAAYAHEDLFVFMNLADYVHDAYSITKYSSITFAESKAWFG